MLQGGGWQGVSFLMALKACGALASESRVEGLTVNSRLERNPSTPKP